MRRLGGSAAPAGAGPPLLRLLPPGPARRAADLRRGGAGARHRRPRSSRCSTATRRGHRPGRRRQRHLLLDQPLPGRAARHLARQFSDQAGRRRAAGASCPTCRPSPRSRRCRAFAPGCETRRAARGGARPAAQAGRLGAGRPARRPGAGGPPAAACAPPIWCGPGATASCSTRWRASTCATAPASSGSTGRPISRRRASPDRPASW